MTNPDTNPIGYLQEIVQKYNIAPFPKYEEKGASGPDHARSFTCQCIYDGYESYATGTTKKQAKVNASKKMIELLENNGYFAKHNVNIRHFDIASAQPLISNLDDSGYDSMTNQKMSSNVDSYKNYISLLQEYCQQKKIQLPIYTEFNGVSGCFIVECRIGDKKTRSQGISKKATKTDAALQMCKILNLVPHAESSKEDISSEKITPDINYVSKLQEYCVSKQMQLPIYKDVGFEMNMFAVSCSVENVFNIGKSATKKAAKQIAAKGVVHKLKIEEHMEKPKQQSCTSAQNTKLVGIGSDEKDGATDIAIKMEALNLEESEVSNLNVFEQIVKSSTTNAISLLQEFCQQEKTNLPTYIEGVNVGGTFLCECHVLNKKTYGQAMSKICAKIEAANEMCKLLNLVSVSTSSITKLNENLIEEKKNIKGETVVSGKNFVSKLQEYCLLKKITLPVYKEEPLHNNMFSISCTVNNISESGRSTTKKAAKLLAAMQVFRKLRTDNEEGFDLVLPVKNTAISRLNEFELSDDEEESNIVAPSEALSINDTLVEIEPTSK